MHWRGRAAVPAAVLAVLAVLVVFAAGCGRFGGAESDDPTSVGDGIRIPSVKPTVTLDRPGSPVTGSAPVTTAPPAVGDTVPPPASVAGPPDPCAGKSTNVAERIDATGLVVRITVAPTLCFGTAEEITVALDVANRGTETHYYSSRHPTSVVLSDREQKVVWSSCTRRGASTGAPPDVPIEIAPGEDARVGVLTYEPADTRCGTVPVGVHTAVASLLTCTAADAADHACDENSLVPVASPGLRFEVR